MDNKSKVILQTLAYSDMFNYPLTLQEISHFLLFENILHEKLIQNLIKDKKVVERNGYYCLPKRVEITKKREKRRFINKEKMLIAKKISTILKFIPTVLFIGVSGSVAMENATDQDDIDLFFITEKNSLWITRLLVLILLEILGKRRSHGATRVSNMICPNMFLDASQLSFTSKYQDIYTAHEIMQLKPLVNKKNTYTKLIRANKWINRLLPNAYGTILEGKKIEEQKQEKNTKDISFFEKLAREVQLWYIQRHKTTEIITDSKLAFHPRDYRKEILKKWEDIQKKYEI